MQATDVEGLLKRGLEALDQGDTLSALSYFEKAIKIERSPAVCSYYAFCIAKERGQVGNAISLCKEAIQKEPGNSLHYFNLGKIYLIDNNKEEAIKTFREGLNYEANPLIVDELNKLGPRKPPIISFLKRSNPVNKYFGMMRSTKKWFKMLYILLPLLLAVTTASVLLPRLFLEKPVFPPSPLEVKPEMPPSTPEVGPEIPSPLPEVKHKKPSPPSEVKHQAPPPPEVKHDMHTLELIAEDTTWIFITIDGSESKEMLLNQGDCIKLSAKNVFSLKIGNAGGIKLIFDGKEVGSLGEEGQVVTLTLPSPAIPKDNALIKDSKTE